MYPFEAATEAELLALACLEKFLNHPTAVAVRNSVAIANGVLGWNDANRLIKLFKRGGFSGFNATVHGVSFA